MKANLKFFKKKRFLPVDKFFQKILYDKKIGYYASKQPIGIKGDFITSPKISNLFSEVIAIWIISVWQIFGKPKKINIIEQQLSKARNVALYILRQDKTFYSDSGIIFVDAYVNE